MLGGVRVRCPWCGVPDPWHRNGPLQVYFKTNKKAIHEYPNLCNHTRDVFQIPGEV